MRLDYEADVGLYAATIPDMLGELMRSLMVFAACLAAGFGFGQSWMPSQPGKAFAAKTGGFFKLANAAIWLKWADLEGPHTDADFVFGSSWSSKQISCFLLPELIGDGSRYGDFKPHVIHFANGVALEWTSEIESFHLHEQFRISLLDGANYFRTTDTLTAQGGDGNPKSIDLIQIPTNDTKVVGSVPGSPIVAHDFFLGAESPTSHSAVEGRRTRCWIERKLPIKDGQSVTYSCVIGVAPPGQMRRAFLNYLERERPRPYKPFLHYNSWYDLGYFNRYTEAECLNRIRTFGEELNVKRGVKLSSFLFDDGWDNVDTVWNFTKDFSDGFVPMKAEAAKYGAAPGAWLSPWGGYGDPRTHRLAAGAKEGMEIDAEGYALSGPKYYDRFHQVTLDMVTKQGINQFKFDGTGSPDKQYPGSKFASDFDAAIQLIQDLRKAKPGLFVNLTTGTWPSPFWTRYADSIWRGGEDHSFAGVGPDRERWITYRDGDTYHGVVLKGPLYPLNSLMLHGLIYAQHAHNLSTDPTGAFRHEVRSYFGSGTQLQEMYITPSLLSKQNWDDIAECAKWSQANADVLKDTHWVGGDPLRGEVYGWAAWSPRKAILTLRNPSDKPQAFYLEPNQAFELSPSVSRQWSFKLVSGDDRTPIPPATGGRQVLTLKPFDVVSIEGTSTVSPWHTSADMYVAEKPYHQPEMPLAGITRLAIASFDSRAKDQRALPLGNTQTRGFDLRGPGFDEMSAWHPNALVVRFDQVMDEEPGHFLGLAHLLQWRLNTMTTPPRVYVLVSSQLNVQRSLVLQLCHDAGFLPIEAADSSAASINEALSELFLDRKADKKGWHLVSTDSEQPDEGPAKNAIDGDPNTYWHTRYDPKLDKLPHEIVVDMGKKEHMAGFRYLPRQDGGVNGRVKGYQFWASLDGKNWGNPVMAGDLPNSFEATKIKFRAPVSARYFKFVALSEQNGQAYTTAAEIDVIKAP